ncbi:coiled-coil domain-containing protein 39-like [Plutella xylostella]|uniref:coiled-coil domain-containing protein 39-like n=1 Tax=Plutella xylostella TaxID=51655 RepID=UPI0020326223|nr:coiled-coil domain-containing protein 39-like [Plutella xylostella]
MMTEVDYQASKLPNNYMAQLLDELGWNRGDKIPLADPDNQALENLLIERQNEIQRLSEALQVQNQKRADLNKYKKHVHTEYEENTRLLFAHKQQMESQVKMTQAAHSEHDRLKRDIVDYTKQSAELTGRIDIIQTNIARCLKKADSLKEEVCGERGALQEWRAALERKAGDITAIEQFTKQDLSTAKALEHKRQKLKMEHDKVRERLLQLVANLSAEERAAQRISEQVLESMEQRNQMMRMWTAAIENLRQRDTDIRHIREDYAVLEQECASLAEQCREQQQFHQQQRGGGEEAQRENDALAAQAARARQALAQMRELNDYYDSEAQTLQRELAHMRTALEKLHIENRQIMEQQQKKDQINIKLNDKLEELKEKILESQDKSKSSENRAKQLQDILNEEERYASGLATSAQRAAHCAFVDQQKLVTLKNEEKLFYMQIKASRAVMSKLENRHQQVEKNLQTQKETLYHICYQVETLSARVSHMEGSREDQQSPELAAREERLTTVCARHAARVALLERHSARLQDDMRRLTKELEGLNARHTELQSRLKTSALEIDGGTKQLTAARASLRRERVDEALLRLRAGHASRALASLDQRACGHEARRGALRAAMDERLVEIATRRDMFNVQKRALLDECGRLRGEVREREGRIEQLKQRYEIFITSLGRDEAGEQVSVSFFKIKFAADRAELRARGATLDATIARCEHDISALESTLRVMHAHLHRHAPPLATARVYYWATLDAEIARCEHDISALESTLRVMHAHLHRHAPPLATARVTVYRATLDATIARCEHDISALESTLRVMHAHLHRHAPPLATAQTDMAELQAVMSQYYELSDQYKALRADLERAEQAVNEVADRHRMAEDKNKQLCAREQEAETDLESIRSRVLATADRLDKSRDVVRHYLRRARRLFAPGEQWRTFQLAIWTRDYNEAAYSCLRLLLQLSGAAPDVTSRLAALLSSTDCQRHLAASRSQRPLVAFVQRMIDNQTRMESTSALNLKTESVLSTSTESSHSGESMASGYTRRLCALRRSLAPKIQEPQLVEAIPEIVRRNTMSLRVVTLGASDEQDKPAPAPSIRRKSFYK